MQLYKSATAGQQLKVSYNRQSGRGQGMHEGRRPIAGQGLVWLKAGFLFSKDCRLPVQLQRAMAAEAEAAREARAKVRKQNPPSVCVYLKDYGV